jgi:hypothetical protein
MDDAKIGAHMARAYERASKSLSEAKELSEAGLPSVALVWAVRSAEMLLREFVLTPHFLELGDPWERAMKRGSKVLGSGNWDRAFASAEEWYGPFDEPLTTDDRNAWQVWTSTVVRRRNELVHGQAVYEATAEEATDAIAFAERMMSWYAQRVTLSERHPAGRLFRGVLDEMAERYATDGSNTSPDT